ncbi:MAG TPA: DNA repair protein RecO [Burkholderiales bacterium]|nr:DNA repair protein RecO [Burkholderiales bacterium]
MAERARQESREAFVLHSYPYRETSLLLEVFARGFGRVSMVARAARSPRSALRGVLLGFQPLALSWFGKGEVRTLARAEWIGGAPSLQGEALMCGFYVNELLLRLLPREDPHDALLARYRNALELLSSHGDSASALRSFERALLRELGYAMTLDRDSASGSAIDPAKTYRYDPERGPVEVNGAAADTVVSGRTLLDMARDDYADPQTQQQAKVLMRSLLDHRLDYQPLKSRRIFRDLLSL